MHNLFFSLIIVLAVVLPACRGVADNEAGTQSESATQTDKLDFTPFQDVAICLWGVAGLREQPGRGGNVNDYLTSIYFGEKVELLGDTKEVDRERRTYIKIRLSDGQEGWVHQYLFSENSTLGVIAQEAKIYRRPDLMTLKDDVFEVGEIVAVSQQKDEWIKVSGKEKRKSGWIKGIDMISRREEDVVVSVLFQRALQLPNPREQLKELLSLVNNPKYSNSIFIDKVKTQLPIAEDLARIPDNQLYIIASRVNVRSTPEDSKDNVVLQLDEGIVCNVLSKGSEVEIDQIRDFWYQIEVEGQEGWVYGHFTSKRLEP